MERGRDKEEGLSLRSKVKEKLKGFKRFRHRSRGSSVSRSPSPQPGGSTSGVSPPASSQSLPLSRYPAPQPETENAVQDGDSAAIAGVPSVVISPPTGETRLPEQEPETENGAAVAEADTPMDSESGQNGCQEATDQVVPELDADEPLSVKAYAELQEEEQGLVADYRKATLKLQQDGNTEPTEPTDELQQLQQIQTRATQMIDGISDTYLTFTINIGGERKLVVREGVKKVVKLLLKYKDVIKEGMTAAPQGALIWAGVTVVLPMLQDMFQQDEDAVDGFGQITTMMVRLSVIEKTFLTSRSIAKGTEAYPLCTDLKKHVVATYKLAYQYQMKIVSHYARNKFRRKLDALTKTDWKDMTTKAEKECTRVEKNIQTWAFADDRARYDSLTGDLATIGSDIKNLHDEMKTGFHQAEDGRIRETLNRLDRASTALFDSHDNRDKRECLQGTQQETLSRIQDWLDDNDAELVFLLQGMAGTGKSSIAKTVATALDKARRITGPSSEAATSAPSNAFLAGSFFFRHDDDNRNSLQRLFTTIATSLADRVPAVRKHVAEAIQNNPDIGTKILQEQSDCLVLGPLSRIDQSLPFAIHPVVVIDALDECANLTGAASLVTLLAGLNKLSKARLRFILTSRPDTDPKPQTNTTLCKTVELKKIKQVSGTHQLQDSDDITRMLVHDMNDIAKTSYKGKPWLKEDDIQRLVQRADGLFIYAATISRFLEGKFNDSIRRKRLDMIFDQTSVNNRFSPDAALNSIYSSVLGFPHLDLTEEEKTDNFRPALQILGCISLVLEPVSIETMCKILDLTEDSLRNSLSDIHAIVHVPPPGSAGTSNDQTLGFFHLSFREFLLSKERAGKFWVDGGLVHQTLVESCMTILEKELRQDICNLHSPGVLKSEIPPQRVSRYIRPHLRYACLYWVRHLAELTTDAQARVGLRENGRVHNLLRTMFLFWLEAMSLLESTGELVRLVKVLETLLHQESNELSAFIHDAWRFALRHRTVAAEAPLQIYISALIFSPTESIIRRTFTRLIPKWITRVPKVETHWDRRLFSMNAAHLVNSIMISRDGMLLIVQNWNRLLAFDTMTGEQRFKVVSEQIHNLILEGPWLRYTDIDGAWRINIYGAGLGTVEKDDSPRTDLRHIAQTSAVEGLSRYENVKLPFGSRLTETHTFEKTAIAVFRVDKVVEDVHYNISVIVWSPLGNVLWKRTEKLHPFSLYDHKIAVSEDFVLIRNSTNTISAWSTVCGTLLWKCLCPEGIFAWASTESNRRVAIASRKHVGVFDIHSPSAPLFFIDWEHSPIQCCCFSTSDMLFVGDRDGYITTIDTVLTPSTTASLDVAPPHGNQLVVAGEIQESPLQLDRPVDGRYVALGFGLGLVTVTRPDATPDVDHYSVQLWDSTLTRIVFQCGQVVAMSTSVHLRTIVLVTLSSVLEVDVDTLTTRTLLSPTPKDCSLHRLTPDASVSVWKNGESLYAITMETRSELYYVHTNERYTRSFFVERSLTMIESGNIWTLRSVKDIATGLLLWEVKDASGIAESTSQGFVMAVVGSRDQQLQIFDIKTKTVVKCLSLTPRSGVHNIYTTWSGLFILRRTLYNDEDFEQFVVILERDMYNVRCAYRVDHDQSPLKEQLTSVSMEEDSSQVIFNGGRLLNAIDRGSLLSRPISKPGRKCLHAGMKWIYQDHRRLIWTGPENGVSSQERFGFRASDRIWVSGGSVRCALESGSMLVLNIDLESTPYARGWDIADGDVSDDCELMQSKSWVVGLDAGDIWAQPDELETDSVDDDTTAGEDGAVDNDSSAGEDSSAEDDTTAGEDGALDDDNSVGDSIPAGDEANENLFGQVDGSDEEVDGSPGESTEDETEYDYGDFVGAECFFDTELSKNQGWTRFEP